VTALRTDFVQRFSPRRAVAFAAALAVALSTLVTSYVGARAAADAIVDPFNIICHAGNPSTAPQSGEGDSGGGAAKLHVDCCSLGCMTAMAAAPPRIALPIAHPAGRLLSWAVTAAVPEPAPSRSYRSRAPPQQA
jgi:hypothetical protein